MIATASPRVSINGSQYGDLHVVDDPKATSTSLANLSISLAAESFMQQDQSGMRLSEWPAPSLGITGTACLLHPAPKPAGEVLSRSCARTVHQRPILVAQ